MKILVLNTMGKDNFDTFFTPKVQKELDYLGEVRYLEYSNTEEEKELLKEQIRDVDVLFTGWGTSAEASGFDSGFYAAAERLNIMAHTGGSVADLITEDMKKRKDFVLMSGNRYFAESVAQGAICYMLMGQRRLYTRLKKTEEKLENWWDNGRTDGLRGKTIGLLSFGMIAKHVARMLQVFDCKVKVYSGHEISKEERERYNIEVCSLDELFASCDIISVHSGMTAKTFHMVDARLLSMMHDDALLVNTSRGAVVDEQALERELKTGRLRAVLDVFEVEPLPMESGLRGLDNVIVVPHSAGPTVDVRELITLGLIEDVKRYYSGNYNLDNQITMDYAKNMTSHSIVEKVQEKHEGNT